MRIPASHMQGGFSLPELLIALSIMSILGYVSITQYGQLKTSGDSAHAAVIYADALREAQQHALSQDYDSAWGVAVTSTGITVFNGASYALRTSSRDRTYWLPTSVTVTGATTTVFTKFTGLPAAAATTTFTNTSNSASTILSSGGAVGYVL